MKKLSKNAQEHFDNILQDIIDADDKTAWQERGLGLKGNPDSDDPDYDCEYQRKYRPDALGQNSNSDQNRGCGRGSGRGPNKGANMNPLRKKLIRLAQEKPELRPHLFPLLKKEARLGARHEVASYLRDASQILGQAHNSAKDMGVDWLDEEPWATIWKTVVLAQLRNLDTDDAASFIRGLQNLLASFAHKLDRAHVQQ